MSSLPISSRCAVVVEDEWLVRMEIADGLEAAGWQVLEFSSGEAAVAILDGQSPPHLLVTDIRLLGAMSGWDLAQAYRTTWPEIAVIYASANPQLGDRQVANSVFMEKPSRVAELVITADRLWNGGR
ncbi:response regulator [Novosphingobium resinovorum]|uniref:response regulator n=1 Tax=Novosphingobium resinovorum TaxID=158500 RepID=UPI002ED697DB|nr:response regulator [Novosphingobium resinovorum]